MELKQINDDLFNRYPILISCKSSIEEAIQLLVDCFEHKHKLLICGNGGSAADSLHIVGELMKAFNIKRSISEKLSNEIKKSYPQDADYLIQKLEFALPAISLVNEASLITAFSNDKAPDLIFAQQVLGYGQPGDVLLAISTSGKSKNVIHACQIAKLLDLNTIALTGMGKGCLNNLCDVVIAVPETETYKIQELHLPVYHAICAAIEYYFSDLSK